MTQWPSSSLASGLTETTSCWPQEVALGADLAPAGACRGRDPTSCAGWGPLVALLPWTGLQLGTREAPLVKLV